MIKVPQGMSCVNAFHALWKQAKPTACFQSHTKWLEVLAAEKVDTPEKVAHLFTTRIKFENEGGKIVRIDFTPFPQLDVRLYDAEVGIGAAERALQAYAEIPSASRFDPKDSYRFEELKTIRDSIVI